MAYRLVSEFSIYPGAGQWSANIISELGQLKGYINFRIGPSATLAFHIYCCDLQILVADNSTY